MNTLYRLWNVLFGQWFTVTSDRIELVGERIIGNSLLLTIHDEHYQLQLRLSAEQADQLRKWLVRTAGPLNPSSSNRVIRLPENRIRK